MSGKPGWGGAIAAVLVGYAVGAVLAVVVPRAPRDELAAVTEPTG